MGPPCPRFLRKLRRLVRLGETALVEEDIEKYDGTDVERIISKLTAEGRDMTPIPGRVVLRSDIESAALATPGVRWPKAARYFAEQYHMTVPQFRRWAPWAEKLWREQTANARMERRLRAKWEARKSMGA